MEILLIFAIIGFIFKIMEKDEKREAYYPNGKLLARAYFNKKGEINGIEERFYENGVIKAKIEWKNGKIEGICENYYYNGRLESRIPIRNDVIWGTVENYYRNGKLKSKIYYRCGVEEEILEFYDELGEKKKKLDLDSLLNRKNK